MFTGIIEAEGKVKSIEKQGAFGRMVIESAALEGVALGDSVSIDGVCLTVTKIGVGSFCADISDETLRLTTLGELKPGGAVNLERALTLSKPLGGHLVTGHVDGVGSISGKTKKGEYQDIEFSIPAPLMGQVVKKGSIAIDGISLTVADLNGTTVKVAVIPHTLEKTTLGRKAPGAKVNIETDIIGKYVEKYFRAAKGGNITEGFLSEHGFK